MSDALLVLNAGSSSLKFSVFLDEEARTRRRAESDRGFPVPRRRRFWVRYLVRNFFEGKRKLIKIIACSGFRI